VIAGLAILGTLLASLVVTRARYLHQWALAGRREQAAVATDELLGSWWSQPEKLPRNSEGQLPRVKMHWRTQTIDNAVAKDLDVQVVRIEIFEQAGSVTESPAASASTSPLIQLDVVVNTDKNTKTQGSIDTDASASLEAP
jgi:hypothetical protein